MAAGSQFLSTPLDAGEELPNWFYAATHLIGKESLGKDCVFSPHNRIHQYVDADWDSLRVHLLSESPMVAISEVRVTNMWCP